MTDLEKIQDQLEKAMSELKELNNNETQLAYDYIEYSNILVKNLILYGVSPRFSITKIRLRSVKAEKRKFGISVIDLTDEVKYLRLMVVQLYFFSFGISYLLNEG